MIECPHDRLQPRLDGAGAFVMADDEGRLTDMNEILDERNELAVTDALAASVRRRWDAMPPDLNLAAGGGGSDPTHTATPAPSVAHDCSRTASGTRRATWVSGSLAATAWLLLIASIAAVVRSDGPTRALLSLVPMLGCVGTLTAFSVWQIRERRGERRLLTAQYAIAQILADAPSVEDAAPRIMRAVCEGLGWYLGALWRVDEVADRLRFIDMWACPGVPGEAFATDSPSTAFHRGEGMLGRCWAGGRALWAAELESQPLKRRDLLVGSGFRSAFCFPITSDGIVIGVMEFLSCQRRGFDPQLLVAVEGAGRQIGQFLRRREAEARAHDLDAQRRHLLGEILLAEEEERARIATALHDDTIQVLAATLLNLDRVAHSLERHQPERARDVLSTARHTIDTAVERARTLMFALRPPLLETDGLPSAIADVADQAALGAGFRVVVDVDVPRYPQPIEALVYRTVQEAITNTAKHADATTLHVRLRDDDGAIEGLVEDDGRGYDPHAVVDRRHRRLHLGLDAMAERIRTLGGDLTIDTAPGRGTRIRFRTRAVR